MQFFLQRRRGPISRGRAALLRCESLERRGPISLPEFRQSSIVPVCIERLLSCASEDYEGWFLHCRWGGLRFCEVV